MADVGERKNANKPRWRNFPLFLVEPLVDVGAAAEKHPGNPNGKYDTFNFLKGMRVNDCLDCAKRHLMKAESPYHDDLDDETKVHHLAHAAWNCLIALHNIKTRPDLDDRYKTTSKTLIVTPTSDEIKQYAKSTVLPEVIKKHVEQTGSDKDGDYVILKDGQKLYGV